MIVLVGVVASVVITVNNRAPGTPTSPISPNQPVDNSPTEATDVSDYKDGTYSATGSYVSPGGREAIELTVTIKDGVITDTALVKKATDRDAERFQEVFAQNYKSLVVGKKVNGLSLSRVAGSSLTSNGFNNALTKIKEDAKG